MNIINYAVLFFSFALYSCDSISIEKSNLSSNYGKIVKIIDGDTYDILLEGNNKIRVRMEGIDAPEKGMPLCNVAKKYLKDICSENNIRLVVTGKDRHGRTLAYSYLDDGRELSHEMIKAGLAWHFKKYSSDTTLALLEIEAKELRIGLWKLNNPMSPWRFRELHHNGVPTRDSFNIREDQQ